MRYWFKVLKGNTHTKNYTVDIHARKIFKNKSNCLSLVKIDTSIFISGNQTSPYDKLPTPQESYSPPKAY